VGKPAGLNPFGIGKAQAMRLMLGIWVVLIAAGIVFFAIVGLSHR
jgi:hypothetical protein